MRTVAVDDCPACGGLGPVVYRGLCDRLFHVPGSWDLRRCETCGSLWLDPRPVDADLHLGYREYYTHPDETPRQMGFGPTLARLVRLVRDAGMDNYIARRFGYPTVGPPWGRAASLVVASWPARRLDAEFKIMRLHARELGRLLDVGCGDGVALMALRERGWEVQGVDFDPAAVDAARARGLTVDLGSLAEQGYGDESFDVVIMSHSLEHVPRPDLVLAEAWRVLRPGGRLVVLTPNASSWLHRRYGSQWQPLDPPRHLQIFTPSALAALAEGAGFRALDASTTERSANGVARAAWKLRRDDHWDIRSRPSLRERIPMEIVQLWEGWKIRREPDAGEELVVVGTK